MVKCSVVFLLGCQVLYDCNWYLLVLCVNGFLFVFGQVGSCEDGLFELELGVQVCCVFDNLNVVLCVVGCMFDDVVDVMVFFVDFEVMFKWVWEIVYEYWGDVLYLMLIVVGVIWLYGFQFEIKVIVWLLEMGDV